MNRSVLITGATDGIGRQTAFRLAQMGHRVFFHGRNNSHGKEIETLIRKETRNNRVHYVNADFTSFSDIEGLVEVLLHKGWIPDILINNAGIYQPSYELVTEEHIEKTFMVNYLAPFYLTYLLVPIMEERRHPIVVNVSSMIHAKSIDFKELIQPSTYDATTAYSVSKLCNILHAGKIARAHSGIQINAVHPGVIDTKLFRAGWGGGGSDPNAGADQLIFAALELPTHIKGSYIEYSNETEPAPVAKDEAVQDDLFELSKRLIPKSS